MRPNINNVFILFVGVKILYNKIAIKILLYSKSIYPKHLLTLSGPNRWETDKIVSFLHTNFKMRSGKG
jgi:hypothetical protein